MNVFDILYGLDWYKIYFGHVYCIINYMEWKHEISFIEMESFNTNSVDGINS